MGEGAGRSEAVSQKLIQLGDHNLDIILWHTGQRGGNDSAIFAVKMVGKVRQVRMMRCVVPTDDALAHLNERVTVFAQRLIEGHATRCLVTRS